MAGQRGRAFMTICWQKINKSEQIQLMTIDAQKVTNQGNISLERKVDLDDDEDYNETPHFCWKS